MLALLALLALLFLLFNLFGLVVLVLVVVVVVVVVVLLRSALRRAGPERGCSNATRMARENKESVLYVIIVDICLCEKVYK